MQGAATTAMRDASSRRPNVAIARNPHPRHLPVEAGIAGLVHGAHATASQGADHMVVTEYRTDFHRAAIYPQKGTKGN